MRGVIDFGHMAKTYRVMEVAIAIAYHSMGSEVVGAVNTGGYLLAGYFRHVELNDAELDALKVLSCARICQSVVLGRYNYMQNPSNDYTKSTGNIGWEALQSIWSTPQPELLLRWKRIMQNQNACIRSI